MPRGRSGVPAPADVGYTRRVSVTYGTERSRAIGERSESDGRAIGERWESDRRAIGEQSESDR